MEPLVSCIPCIIKQIIYSARAVSDDAWLQKQVVSNALKGLAETDYSVLPVTLANRIFSNTVKTLGVTDPFQEQKNELLADIPSIVELIGKRAKEVSDDPVDAALKLCAAANHFLGFSDLEETLGMIIKIAKNKSFAFELERFVKEYRKKSKAVLLTGGFLELPFDIHLLKLMEMEEITFLASPRNFLWHFSNSDVQKAVEIFSMDAEVNEFVYDVTSLEPEEIVSDGDFFICKGFINYQYFETCAKTILSIFYAHKWCQPAMSAVQSRGSHSSGMVVKFNI